MPDERLLKFLIDCFAHNKLQASCEEGVQQHRLAICLLSLVPVTPAASLQALFSCI